MSEVNAPLPFLSEASLILKEEELSKLTSYASINDLKAAIPAELMENSSLLPFAGNLFVVGIANKNGDCLNPEDVFAYYKQFKHTRLTLEHKQDTIIGHIVDVGFSKYDPEWQRGTGSEIITEEEARKLDEPFNCWVAGVIYKENAPSVVKKIERSNDPESDDYLKVSLSWEVRYYECHILLGMSVFNGKIISDSEKKSGYLRYLKSSTGGKGVLKDGTAVNRLIYGDWTPLGAGCTLSPAAQVKGVVIPDEELEIEDEEGDEEGDENESSESHASEHFIEKCSCGAVISQCRCGGEKTITVVENGCASCKNKVSEANIEENVNISDNSEDKSSLLENTNVIKNDNTNIIIKKPMKYIDSFASLEKLTDEDIKSGEISIANLQAVYKDAIKQADAAWLEKVNAEKTALAEAQTKIASIESQAKEASEKAVELEKEVNKLKDIQASAEHNQKFQTRMAAFNEKYELNDSERAILAKTLKDISDEDYESTVNDYSVLFAAKDKEKMKAEKEKAEKEEKDKKEKGSKANVEGALANASVETPVIPNNPGSDVSLLEKHKEAFSKIQVSK